MKQEKEKEKMKIRIGLPKQRPVTMVDRKKQGKKKECRGKYKP